MDYHELSIEAGSNRLVHSFYIFNLIIIKYAGKLMPIRKHSLLFYDQGKKSG